MTFATSSDTQATNARRGRKRLSVFVLLSTLGFFALFSTSCSPGKTDGNYVYYVANWADPTASALYVYVGNSLFATYAAGSGTSIAANTHPCNKYTGSGDSNGGGHLPGFESASASIWSPVPNWYDSPSNAWDPSHSFGSWTSKTLKLSNAYAQGTSFDCAATGSIIRDGLYVHRKHGTWVSYGCIKIDEANLDTLDNVFHDLWGGVNSGSYTQTAKVM